jgi:ATP-binding cassette subfamily E protein 1
MASTRLTHRVAVVDRDFCHSKKCNLECINFCPVNIGGAECIVLGEDGKAVISEALCTGCGICVKKCPFDAITIVNLPEELGREKIHQYGVNGFRLYRLPVPKPGRVVGLVGKNGMGKTTALNLLSGHLTPNLGAVEETPEWPQILRAIRNRELKTHLERVASGKLKVAIKPQAVYKLPEIWRGDVLSLLRRVDERGLLKELVRELGLEKCVERPVREISGGELQRVAIAVATLRDADLYLFDEPSSYNDVFQRLNVARVIRRLAEQGKAVLLVEHDLTLLDYLCDEIHILYGEPGVYGVVSRPYPTRTGINVLLDGYLPGENVRFRDYPVNFEIYAPQGYDEERPVLIEYGELIKRYAHFELRVAAGRIHEGEVVGVLGANSLGKTTFLKLVAGVEKPDEGHVYRNAKISYKPQYLSSRFPGTVRDLLEQTGGPDFEDHEFYRAVVRPFGLHKLLDRRVSELSGGELQKLAVVAAMMRDADIYALDEPSAFIDIEDRVVLAKALQRYIRGRGKSAIVVDHDIQLVDVVSDSLMILTGTPDREGNATPPQTKESGMNLFLKYLGITYRRDVESGRPRVNRPGSKLDRLQKEQGTYYYLAKAAAE